MSTVCRTAIFGMLFLSQHPLQAATLEYEIKAAFIYNFAKFVEWGDQTGSAGATDLTLCVLGEDPFDAAIDKLDGRTVQNFNIQVKRIETIREDSGCRIVFVSRSESGRLSDVIQALSGEKGLLSISDIDGFAARGGIIELVLDENKVRFTVNIAAARLSEVNLSSKILRLANIIGDSGGDQ